MADTAIQTLIDKGEIRDVLSRYCRSLCVCLFDGGTNVDRCFALGYLTNTLLF